MPSVKHIALALTYLLLNSVCIPKGNAQTEESLSAMRKLQMAEFAISHFYVDQVDENTLVEEAIKKMLLQLDPHSTYANPDEVKSMNEPLQGEFEGIGIQFQMMEDTLVVIQPVSNGPSEKVGILAGDRIIAVNDTAIAGVNMDTEAIMKRLRGPKGTKVDLTVTRRGIKDLLLFTVKRDKIPILSLDASYIIQPGIGYIRVNKFGATTTSEFQEALKKLKRQGMKDLILDLQGNGGGYLNAATDMANEFLKQKQLIVYTQGRSVKRGDFLAQGNGNFQAGRLVILVDEYSASASEILTGAIQDWDRGVIVGRRSFGKGLVQRPVDLPDGSMIRLTVARYYTPSGRCIQKPYGDRIDYQKDVLTRYNHGEFLTADSIQFPDSLKTQTKTLGRTVYGGGGIMPDIFVPIDTTFYTPYYRLMSAKGMFLKYAMRYIENNRRSLKAKYKNFDAFNKGFEIDTQMLEQFTQAGLEEGIEPEQDQISISLPLIKAQLKALIARDLWDINEYYRVMNKHNNYVRKALEILNTDMYSRILSIQD